MAIASRVPAIPSPAGFVRSTEKAARRRGVSRPSMTPGEMPSRSISTCSAAMVRLAPAIGAATGDAGS
ncbi:hypothetical protein DEM25_007415 [Oceaniradius stylonematis]|uniref:Uncharacterized protein n=1 Tax=Oceaniradius stylonematis TaxID=2184161 RepID=A0A3A8AE16_9HYPH|nr:hypothetical protein DEM25_007415 [Oceaniradius stylonematis]